MSEPINNLLSGYLPPDQRRRIANALMANQFDRPTPQDGPVAERAGLLPLGTYANGQTGIAWPGFVAQPVESFNNLLLRGYQGGTGDTQGVEDAFNVAGGAMTGGLLAPRPSNALAMSSINGRRWIHGTSGDHTTLDPNRAGAISSGAGKGVWVTEPTEMLYASEYAQMAAEKLGGKPRIATFESQNVNNPLIVELNPRTGSGFVVNGKEMDWNQNIDAIKFALNNGHDAIHWVDGSFTDPPSLTTFNANQLKHISD